MSSRPFNNPFCYCAKSTNHNWHNRYFHVPQPFQFSCKVKVLIRLFTFFQFYSVVSRESKVDNFANSLYYYNYYFIPLKFFTSVLSHAVIWIVSTRPPTSKSSRPFNNPLVILPTSKVNNFAESLFFVDYYKVWSSGRD